VIVVGAGPAGLEAATVLAAQQRSVLVLEEHAGIGEPVHCTGVIGLDAFDELDLPRDTICAVSRVARFIGRDGRSVRVDGGEVAAAVVDRGRFDRALAARAHGAGATLHCGARVETITVTRDRVVATSGVSGASCEFRARVCVLACGAQYRFNRRLGLGIPRAYLQTAQVETPFPAVDAVEIDLDRAVAPQGFAWLVPFRRGNVDMARIGLMSSDGAAGRFRHYAERLARRHGGAGVEGRPRLKLIPLAPVRKTYTDRVVAVGDAAGLAKPTTGGGIYYSLLSGRFAAEAVVAALDKNRTDAAALKTYEDLWQARLGPEVRAGLAFRAVAARLDDGAVDALLELAAVDGIVPLLRRTADFNWHRSAALALLKHRGFRRIVLNSLWA
jgi:geranylgeranyl reductase family protein